MSNKPKKQRWYLGGPAGAGAVLVTHPLDLLKVKELFVVFFFTFINNGGAPRETNGTDFTLQCCNAIL